MLLKAFQVQNYRSVNDSGRIEVRQRTALVGRNESGKTSLLKALESLNLPGKQLAPLTYVKDFPRDRESSDFKETLTVVDTWWDLSPADQSALAKVFPRAKGVTEVGIGRTYKGRHANFTDLKQLVVDRSIVDGGLKALGAAVDKGLEGKEEAVTTTTRAALAALSTQLLSGLDKAIPWSASAIAAATAFRAAVSAAGFTLGPGDAELSKVEQHARDIAGDGDAWQKGRDWVAEHIPVFIYLADYPELEGHQNIPEYVQRRKSGQPATKSEENFAKLLKVAGLDAEELNNLLSSGNHEERQQLANRAGAVVTRKLRELWQDRQLKIRFNLDAQHFDTLVSDPESVYDVEINLNERSRGLKWFFSFYVTFAADTSGGPASDAILLFDEPALYLHAVAQQDLLRHFKKDFKNTIIYTTHSPFMVPVEDIAAVRTVTISQERGTQVTNIPTGDSKTLFPLQTALGYDLTQTLFVGDKNLVVEGVSDYWYLRSVSDYLAENGAEALPKNLVLTPAGGAPKVPYMVSLLSSQRLKVLVLLDSETQARQVARDDLIKTKLIRDEYVLFVGNVLGGGDSGTVDADIEDLLDPTVFAQLVEESYKKELTGKQLTLNANIPRIVKRYEEAFKLVGLEFMKTRPARLFLDKMGKAPQTMVTATAQGRFSSLFKLVTERLGALEKQGGPFA